MAGVLIIDDEPNMRWVLQEALGKAGFDTFAAASGEEALRMLGTNPIDLVLLDLKLKGMDGLATLRHIHTRWPDIVVLILTAYGTVATAVEALQGGASDYLRKPFDVEEVVFKINRALERRSMQQELSRLRGTALPPIPGHAPTWRRALEAAVRAVTYGLDLYLVGEPGSGRAGIARAAYAASTRHQAPLVELDLETLPPRDQGVLLVGETDRGGFWSEAGQGALLLRHIGQLSDTGLQAVTTLLQRRAEVGMGPLMLLTGTVAEWERMGSLPHHHASISIPPLRDHLDDLVSFATAWLPHHTLSAGIIDLMQTYAWPGNLSELRGVLERAAQLALENVIEERHLPMRVRNTPLPDAPIRLPSEGISLEAVEISLIRQALERAGGNKTRAAELLGLTRHTLLYRLEKYKISEE